MNKNLRITVTSVLLLIITVFSSLTAQNTSNNQFNHPDYQKLKISLQDNPGFFPDNFNIRFDINRLANLKPKEENLDEVFYYPDSIDVYSVAENPVKYTYYYSELGERQMTLSKKLSNEVWVNNYLEVFTYDSVSNMLTHEVKDWQNEAWVQSSLITNTFGPNHILLTSLNQNWNGTAYVNSEKDTYTYNTADKPVAYLKEMWTGDAWSNVLYDLYTYDAFGNMVSAIRQTWEINTWINSFQNTYTYDANNNMLTGIIQIWEADAWVNFYMESYTYDTANQPIEYVGQFWTNEAWVNAYKYTNTYNEYGFVTLVLEQIWLNDSWTNSYRSSFTQNFYGGIQSALVEVWIPNSWVNDTLTTYSHDDNGNTLTADIYTWNGDTWMQEYDGTLDISYYYNLRSESFRGYLARASYISITTGIRTIAKNNILNFVAVPNPSTGPMALWIDIKENTNAEIALFNLSGTRLQTLYQGNLVEGENQINMNTNDLPAGIYLVKLSADNMFKFLKLIVTK